MNISIRHLRTIACIALTFLSLLLLGAKPADLDQTDVFVSGTGGYHTYRIPALLTSTNGTLLAFCEGRKVSSRDAGAVDVLLKRSTDAGRHWLTPQVVWSDGDNTCGNPAVVVDQITGEVWLLMTWNRGADNERAINDGTSVDTRRVFVTSSRDNGAAWSKPKEITDAVKRTGWRWYATGPGSGIQLTRGPHAGRLVIPANHTELTDTGKIASRAHIFYSDDHGRMWKLGGSEEEMTNESTIVERADGTLLHNMRSYHGKHRRAIATSADGGLTWSAVSLDPALIEPVCEGSLVRFSWPRPATPGIVLFSNPASIKRENLTVRLSYDDGATWPASHALYSGPSAYSCLAVLPDRTIGCLYECGTNTPYEKLTLARFAEFKRPTAEPR